MSSVGDAAAGRSAEKQYYYSRLIFLLSHARSPRRFLAGGASEARPIEVDYAIAISHFV